MNRTTRRRAALSPWWAVGAAGVLVGAGVRRLVAGGGRAPEFVAHRGGAATAPENTLAAFRNALAHGVLSWELDVQLTRDGALAVFHDETLDRTTDGHGPLAGRTLAELQALDAGSWFGLTWAGEQIPTLEAVIALARTAPGGGARLLIEIKSPHLYPGIERRLLAVLDAADYRDRVLVMSFDGESLARVRALAPQMPLCHLMGESSFYPARPAARAEVIGPMWQLLAANPLTIPATHRRGRRVYAWTVNSARGLRWLRAWGIDGIISDRIDLLEGHGAAK